METLQQHSVQKLQCLLRTEGHSSIQGLPLQPLKPPRNSVCDKFLILPSAAESGIECHAFQDGVRGVPAEFTSYSHHPDCAHHSRHAGTVGHHYHEHAQRRAHPEAVLGQIQRPHLFRYKKGFCWHSSPPTLCCSGGCQAVMITEQLLLFSRYCPEPRVL